MELIQALRDSDYLLSKSEAENIVRLFFDGMADALAKGDGDGPKKLDSMISSGSAKFERI